MLATIGRKLTAAKLRPAYWFLFLLIGAILAIVAPGGIIYFLIPPAVVLLGMAASRRYPSAEAIGALVGMLLLYLGWSELLGALEELFSPGPLWVVAPVAAILITPALIEARSLFAGENRRAVLLGSAAVALVAWTAAGIAPAYSQDHQQRFTIEHVTDFPSGRSSWSIVNDGARLPEPYRRWGEWRRGSWISPNGNDGSHEPQPRQASARRRSSRSAPSAMAPSEPSSCACVPTAPSGFPLSRPRRRISAAPASRGSFARSEARTCRENSPFPAAVAAATAPN